MNSFSDVLTSTGNFTRHLKKEHQYHWEKYQKEKHAEVVAKCSANSIDKHLTLNNENITKFILKYLIIGCSLPLR